MVRMKITDEMIRATLRETPYWKRLRELFMEDKPKKIMTDDWYSCPHCGSGRFHLKMNGEVHCSFCLHPDSLIEGPKWVEKLGAGIEPAKSPNTESNRS
jgi:DNA-directed RNA polymerase subunit RPC12/RpoP